MVISAKQCKAWMEVQLYYLKGFAALVKAKLSIYPFLILTLWSHKLIIHCFVWLRFVWSILADCAEKGQLWDVLVAGRMANLNFETSRLTKVHCSDAPTFSVQILRWLNSDLSPGTANRSRVWFWWFAGCFQHVRKSELATSTWHTKQIFFFVHSASLYHGLVSDVPDYWLLSASDLLSCRMWDVVFEVHWQTSELWPWPWSCHPHWRDGLGQRLNVLIFHDHFAHLENAFLWPPMDSMDRAIDRGARKGHRKALWGWACLHGVLQENESRSKRSQRFWKVR